MHSIAKPSRFTSSSQYPWMMRRNWALVLLRMIVHCSSVYNCWEQAQGAVRTKESLQPEAASLCTVSGAPRTERDGYSHLEKDGLQKK